MEVLGSEIFLEYLIDDELLSLCRTSKLIMNLCECYIKSRVEKRYGIILGSEWIEDFKILAAYSVDRVTLSDAFLRSIISKNSSMTSYFKNLVAQRDELRRKFKGTESTMLIVSGNYEIPLHVIDTLTPLSMIGSTLIGEHVTRFENASEEVISSVLTVSILEDIYDENDANLFKIYKDLEVYRELKKAERIKGIIPPGAESEQDIVEMQNRIRETEGFQLTSSSEGCIGCLLIFCRLLSVDLIKYLLRNGIELCVDSGIKIKSLPDILYDGMIDTGIDAEDTVFLRLALRLLSKYPLLPSIRLINHIGILTIKRLDPSSNPSVEVRPSRELDFLDELITPRNYDYIIKGDVNQLRISLNVSLLLLERYRYLGLGSRTRGIWKIISKYTDTTPELLIRLVEAMIFSEDRITSRIGRYIAGLDPRSDSMTSELFRRGYGKRKLLVVLSYVGNLDVIKDVTERLIQCPANILPLKILVDSMLKGVWIFKRKEYEKQWGKNDIQIQKFLLSLSCKLEPMVGSLEKEEDSDSYDDWTF